MTATFQCRVVVVLRQQARGQVDLGAGQRRGRLGEPAHDAGLTRRTLVSTTTDRSPNAKAATAAAV